jgi:hypothetical protein
MAFGAAPRPPAPILTRWWIDRNNCDRKNWSRVRIPKTWIHFFLANLANFYESLKRNNRGEGQKPLGK